MTTVHNLDKFFFIKGELWRLVRVLPGLVIGSVSFGNDMAELENAKTGERIKIRLQDLKDKEPA